MYERWDQTYTTTNYMHERLHMYVDLLQNICAHYTKYKIIEFAANDGSYEFD